MPLITFEPIGKTIDAPSAMELLDAARKAEVDIQSPCGGKGTCGKCLVRITSGKVDSDSLGLLSASAVADGFVLACKTKILDVPVTVEIPEQIGKNGGQFIDETDDTCLVERELLPGQQVEPLVQKWALDIPGPQLEDGLSDLDRLSRAIQQNGEKKEIIFPLPVIRRTAAALREKNGKVTVSLATAAGQYHIINIQTGDQSDRSYGIAVDIGTTTAAVQLVSLTSASVIATRTAYNDQIDCGLDVISRINYARKPERLEELRTRALSTIDNLVEQVCSGHDVEPAEICSAVIAGNTTMIHLLLGLPPEYIRLEPYTPTLLASPFFTAEEIGIGILPQTHVYIAPAVGSYVGGDIASGLLCTDMAADSEDINLFIDIGTNGELVIGNRDFLMTCACSAGPAFEGGGIGHGMRAAAGAIENVAIDPQTGAPSCQVIGQTKARGICGSGMISLLANLFLTGWLDPAGKLNRTKESPVIQIDGRQARYVIVPAGQSADGKPITVNESDIENIIRAKAAIYSACALMLDQVGLSFDDLSKIYIAGGFGRFLDIEKAIIIGLIPDLPREKYRYVGNSSLMGAYMALVSRHHRERQQELARRMTYIELNTAPAYMDQYTAALFIPHTDITRFPSVAASGGQNPF